MNQLVLTPRDPDWRCSRPGQLSEALRDLGFSALETFHHEDRCHYHAGERFLELMTFVGCAPVVMTGQESIEDENFYHIHIVEKISTPVLLLSSDARPRCGQCKKPMEEWQEVLQRYQQERTAESVCCHACGSENDVFTFNWKRAGGVAGVHIAIHGVFPHEAVPSDELMQHLQLISGLGWDYFYYT